MSKSTNRFLFRLIEIDAESIRPLRAIARGIAVQEDYDRLQDLDEEAEEIHEALDNEEEVE